MIEINFRITKPEALKPKIYSLFVDGQKCIEDLKLENIAKELKKYLRLRFKESLK